MCGIFGYIGNIPPEDYTAAHTLLTNLFVESKVRGKDASGFAAIRYDMPDLVTDKRNLDSGVFVNRSDRFKMLKKKMPNIFIGHTRLTTGSDPKRNRNNHPFLSQRLALVHNGRVSEWDKIAMRMNLTLRSETDSEILLRALDKYENILDGCRSILDNIEKDGKYAIAVFNHGGKSMKELYLFRNHQQPCIVFRVEKWKALFFASTEEIIKNALDKSFGSNGRAKFISDFGMEEPRPTSPYTLYRMNHGVNPTTGAIAVIEHKLDAPKSTSTTVVGCNDYSSGCSPSTRHSSTPYVGPVSTDLTTGPGVGIEPGELIIANPTERKHLTEVTAKKIQSLEDALNESSKVVAMLQGETYMNDFEYDHFMKWMLDV